MRIKRCAPAGLLAAMIACSGTGSTCSDCSGMSAVPYPDPAPPGGSVQVDVLHARVTQNALDFVASHIGSLLGSFLTVEGDMGVYYLDETLFDPASDPMVPILIRDGCIGDLEMDLSCAGTSTGKSKISFDLDAMSKSLSLTWLDADTAGRPGMRFSITDFELFIDMVMVTNIDLLGAAACHVQNPTGVAALQVAEMSFDIRLGIDRTGPTPVFATAVENVNLDLGSAVDDSALNLTVAACDGVADLACTDPCCGGTCDSTVTQASCDQVCGLFDLFAQLGGFLTSVLEPLLAELGPQLAGAVSDALRAALADAPLGTETELDLGELTGELLSGAQPLRFKAGVGNVFDVLPPSPSLSPGRGLDIGIDVGLTAAVPAVCATDVDPADFSLLSGAPPDYTGFVEVFDDTLGSSHFEAYHIGMSISEAMLAQFLWGAFLGGAFCLRLDAYDIEELSGGAFSLTAGLLMNFDARLTGLTEQDAPMLLTLWSTKPPTVRIGAGGAIAAGMEDPLIEVIADDMQIGISMMIDDDQKRVTGIVADLIIRMGVERTPNQNLELVLQSIEVADLRQEYNELAPSADLSGLFGLVIDLAVGQLLGDSLSFELNFTEAIAGALSVPLYLRLNALRRDLGPTGASFMTIYATLCDEVEVDDPNNTTCFVPGGIAGNSVSSLAARLADESSLYVEADLDRFPPDRWVAAPSGRALLQVEAGPLRPEATIYQFRVDHGAWSTFRPAPDGLLVVDSFRLLVLGQHLVQVRARPVGATMERTDTVDVRFWVDRERPYLAAWRTD
ncbi:MAG: hypothetical protein V3T05_08025, partial [Myxococcota bacterium]